MEVAISYEKDNDRSQQFKWFVQISWEWQIKTCRPTLFQNEHIYSSRKHCGVMTSFLGNPQQSSRVYWRPVGWMRSDFQHSLQSVKPSVAKRMVLNMQKSLEDMNDMCVSLHSRYLVAECGDTQPICSQLWAPSFTVAVDRGWTMMARMCGEQLRIIQATSPVHVCMNLYRHSSIKSGFFQSSANERFSPLKHHPGRSGWKTQQLPSFVPLASKEQVVL